MIAISKLRELMQTTQAPHLELSVAQLTDTLNADHSLISDLATSLETSSTITTSETSIISNTKTTTAQLTTAPWTLHFTTFTLLIMISFRKKLRN